MSSWSDAVSEIAKSLDVFNRLVDAIVSTYRAGTTIVDDQSARRLRDSLKDLKMEMSGVNATKTILNKDILEYLTGLRRHDWHTLQDHLKATAARIGKVCQAVEATDIGGMKLRTELIIALKSQEREYANLAGFPAPSSDQDKKEAEEIAKGLAALLSKVTELEHTLDEQTRTKGT
jgi:hypothetical protein